MNLDINSNNKAKKHGNKHYIILNKLKAKRRSKIKDKNTLEVCCMKDILR